jgi:pimeloyl-ACP methyl ester carboxylesterase
MPVLTLKQGNIAYADSGAGDVVVLVHSSGNTRAQWRKLQQLLSPRYRVLALDLFDYGESAGWGGERPMSVEDQTQPVIAVAALAGGGRLHLVGHSNGAGIALRAAIALQSRVASLTLVEPVVPCLLRRAGEHDAFAEFAALKSQFLEHIARGDTGAAASCFLAYWGKPGTWESMPADRQLAIAATMPKIAEEFHAVFADDLSVAAVGSVSVRTLLIRGESTTLVARRMTEIVQRALPQARLVVIPGAGHMCPLTHAEAVNKAIALHLATPY